MALPWTTQWTPPGRRFSSRVPTHQPGVAMKTTDRLRLVGTLLGDVLHNVFTGYYEKEVRTSPERTAVRKQNCEAALMGLGVGKCTQLGNWVETDVIIIFHNCPISLNISYFVSWIGYQGSRHPFSCSKLIEPPFLIYIYVIMCHYSLHKNHQFPKFNWHPIYP